MSESIGAQPGATVPTFYVDAVHLSAQPFTLQLVFGTSDMDGRVSPCVHLTLSPTFAAHLAEMLQRSLDQRPAEAPDGAATDPFVADR